MERKTLLAIILSVVFLIGILLGNQGFSEFVGIASKINPPQIGIGGSPFSTREESQPEDVVESAIRSVVTISASMEEIPGISEKVEEANIGSGFVIASDGYIVTSKHVVSPPFLRNYKITLEGEKYAVRDIYRSPREDIAVLRVDAQNLQSLPLGDSSSMRLGEEVIAIGTTFDDLPNSVTKGVVSGLDREIGADSFWGERIELRNLIQTDAAINPGNSGGPLLNKQGEVIGINSAIAGGAQSVGFAVPVNALKEFLESLPQP